MAYGTPADPVAGTVITVAYARTNILDPIRWLRLITGNADPPGSDYLVRSLSTTSTAWSKATTDLIADGAVTTGKIVDGSVTSAKLGPGVAVANLGYTPVNKAGDTMSGNLGLVTLVLNNPLGHAGVVPRVSGQSDILFLVVDPGPSNGGTIMLQTGPPGGAAATRLMIDPNGNIFLYGNGVYVQPTTTAYGVWHGGNLDPSTITVANSNALGGIPAANYALNNGANNFTNPAQSITGHAIWHTGSLDPATFTVQFANVAHAIDDNTISTTKLQNLAVTDTKVANANKDGTAATPSLRTLGGGSTQAAAGDHTHASGAFVPSGLIAAFATAAAIAAGWNRYTAADGRLLIGAGTTSGTGQSFAENANAGAGAWPHNHQASGLTFTGTAGGSTGGSSANDQVNLTTPGTLVALGSHTHTYTPSGSIGGQVGDTTWIPPSRAVVWAQKT